MKLCDGHLTVWATGWRALQLDYLKVLLWGDRQGEGLEQVAVVSA